VSWKKSTIGDVLSVIRNGINCEQNKIPVGEKITRIETIAKKRFDFERVGYANLTESEKERGQLKVGDILFSHINSPIHVGKTAIYEGEEDIYHGINLLLMRTNKDVNPYFFNQFLNHLFATGYWEANCKKSVNQASVNQKDISKVEFDYPPLATQQKIVAKLDAIFSEIDKASAAAEANAKNAEALFQSYLTKIFECDSEGWKDAALGNLYKVASSKRVLKSDWKSEGVPFYRGREITSLSKFGFVENDLFITEEMYAEYSRTYGVPLADDIMITAIGTIGNTYIVKDGDKFYFKDASVLWLKKEADIDSKFVNYWFKSRHFFSQLDVGLGATVDTLTIGKVQGLQIKIPTVRTQKDVVAKLDSVSSEIAKSIKSYTDKVNELGKLKDSILRQAFSGELVKE